ncbi:hypothetical protein [Pseudoroseomonas cervicalis]|nr:hypothetical protein [Pseudoroseomonas cervicalis]MDQ1081007.1 hypothetical protein [Pseudoroseomonas cervicalis]
MARRKLPISSGFAGLTAGRTSFGFAGAGASYAARLAPVER